MRRFTDHLSNKFHTIKELCDFHEINMTDCCIEFVKECDIDENENCTNTDNEESEGYK